MNPEANKIQNTYIAITLFNTLAASFIWGINTLFLLDAGLNNLEAFSANAFFTAGMVLFEVPTGVVADTLGRRISYLMGTVTLIVTTFAYLMLWNMDALFVWWAVVSVFMGLGFTFFSGAIEAWLVDALGFTKYKGDLDSVFAKGQITAGIAMLIGSVAGGFVAQFTNLGVPYILRIVILFVSLGVAVWMMRDFGFSPVKSKSYAAEMKNIFKASIDNGLRNRKVRWMMLSAPFSFGVGIYVFYALQPYLLELYGNPEAYGIAGLAAAIMAGSNIIGGMSVKYIRKIFRFRTDVFIAGTMVASVALVFVGLTTNFWVAVILLVLTTISTAASDPMRQAFINGVIPSKQRATVLSFDSLLKSAGGVVAQPAMGRVADVYSYSASFIYSGFLWAISLPFVLMAKAEKTESDPIK